MARARRQRYWRAMEPIVNIVLPVFAIVAAGYLCGRRGLLGDDSSRALNSFVYWVALPALLFRAMATVDLDSIHEPDFLLGFAGAIVLLWTASILVAKFVFGRSLAEAALHGMNGVYGNTGYMGIPLAIAAWGEAAALPAIMATVIAALIVGVAIFLIEAGGRGAASPGRVALTAAGAVVKNPMIAAPVLGLLWAAGGLDLPVPVDAFTGILGAAAGPCALFAIGLFMVGKPTSEGRIEVGVMTATKLLVQPALTAVLVFLVFPADPLWAKVAVLMAALPTGAGSFVLAQAYGIYVLRTSSVILASTVLSVATVSVIFLCFPPGV
ncbi:AEC family transporter [Minwuia thermotolerans]|nr:AEC family transporter [Minwuia thermotolerans]